MHTEQQRQQAEDRREAVAAQHHEEKHSSLERRATYIEETVRRLTERFTLLEAHLLHYIETLHRQSHEQEEKNREHLEKSRETMGRNKQRVKDAEQLIGYTHKQMRRSQDRLSPA